MLSARIAAVFSEVLRISPGSINDQTSPENTPQWDSLAVVTLVTAIEDEFGVTLSTREIMSMRSIALVRKVLLEKGVADA
ncbi:MAG: acyl carrier protein [Alphaproteobacteria bacterium]